MNRNARLLTVLAVCGLTSLEVSLGDGSADIQIPLNPAPVTAEELSETKQGTPIHATDLPMTITVPGHYYLAESIYSSVGGISVDADDVVIDLRGFVFAGDQGSAISVARQHHTIEIRNGRVDGWPQNGLEMRNGHLTRVENITVTNCGGAGIVCGARGVIESCVVMNNASHGIWAGYSSRVFASTAVGNGSADDGRGIYVGPGGSVVDCSAWNNALYGIYISNHSVVRGSIAIANRSYGIGTSSWATIEACDASRNGKDGFSLSGHTTLRDSMGSMNGENGAWVWNDCTVTNNTFENNGRSGHGAGIFVAVSGRGYTGSRVDSNSVRQNKTGIEVAGSGNVIVRNAATGNTVNFDIAPGNDSGPIGSASTMTSPWGNIEH